MENLYVKSDNMPGTRVQPYSAIDGIQMPPKPVDRPLRLPVQDVYKISGIGTVPVGKVETGVLERGKTVVFNPSQKSAEVKTLRCTTQATQRLNLVTTLDSRSWTCS